MTVPSMMQVWTGVIEIGRKSACCVGARSFGTGRMEASFQRVGTVEVSRDRVKGEAIGSQNSGAPSLWNQAGIWSRPVAVG